MNVDWSSRQLKEKARDRALDFLPKKEVILMPGLDLCCLRQGIETGIFGKRTTCHLVERGLRTFKAIERESASLSVKAKPFHGELHSLKLSADIDFAFFDFNGPLTIDVLIWMVDELEHRVNRADLSFTLAYAFRNNNLAHACKDFFAESEALRDFHYETSVKFGIGDQTAVMWMAVLRLVFFKYSFRLKHKCYYRDKTPMLMVALEKLVFLEEREIPDDIRRSFGRFLNHFRRFGMNAAQKAHRTRKKNAEKRSNAAKKAWETRLVNGLTSGQKAAQTRKKNAIVLAKKRSNAAKKAWETRRANVV